MAFSNLNKMLQNLCQNVSWHRIRSIHQTSVRPAAVAVAGRRFRDGQERSGCSHQASLPRGAHMTKKPVSNVGTSVRQRSPDVAAARRALAETPPPTRAINSGRSTTTTSPTRRAPRRSGAGAAFRAIARGPAAAGKRRSPTGEGTGGVGGGQFRRAAYGRLNRSPRRLPCDRT